MYIFDLTSAFCHSCAARDKANMKNSEQNEKIFRKLPFFLFGYFLKLSLNTPFTLFYPSPTSIACDVFWGLTTHKRKFQNQKCPTRLTLPSLVAASWESTMWV